MPASSERRIASNRQNAKNSTGPKTAAGKAKSKLNALKHGLRAEQVVLPNEDPKAFEAECAAWAADWQPKSHTRAILVERAAAASWRLRRCVRVEAARLQKITFAAMDRYDDRTSDRINKLLAQLDVDPIAALEGLKFDGHGVQAL